jgi:hypothetical protein
VPFGSSNFEGDEEYRRRYYRRNKFTGRRTEVSDYEDEEFNQPDPSKMHSGVYH